MGDDRHHHLRLRAIYMSRHRARLQVFDGLEAIGQVAEPEVGDLGFGGFLALAGPLRRAAWPLIPWSSCSDTRPMFMQLEVMGVSWQTGFQWPRRESLASGSAGCLRGPSHPGGISASASSTGMHPWDPGQRVRRHTSPSMASSPGV
jgi:hypothetical protein